MHADALPRGSSQSGRSLFRDAPSRHGKRHNMAPTSANKAFAVRKSCLAHRNRPFFHFTRPYGCFTRPNCLRLALISRISLSLYTRTVTACFVWGRHFIPAFSRHVRVSRSSDAIASQMDIDRAVREGRESICTSSLEEKDSYVRLLRSVKKTPTGLVSFCHRSCVPMFLPHVRVSLSTEWVLYRQITFEGTLRFPGPPPPSCMTNCAVCCAGQTILFTRLSENFFFTREEAAFRGTGRRLGHSITCLRPELT